MAASYAQVSVGTSATLIVPANNARRGSLLVNNSSQTIFLGMDALVTIANGLPILTTASFSNSGQNEVWKGAIWGIVASTTADVRYWEFE